MMTGGLILVGERSVVQALLGILTSLVWCSQISVQSLLGRVDVQVELLRKPRSRGHPPPLRPVVLWIPWFMVLFLSGGKVLIGKRRT